MIPPTVGRIVWYYPPGAYRFSNPAQPLAAQIAYVHSAARVNLGFLAPDGRHESAQDVRLVQEGDPAAPGEEFCCWMPYQVGQAKAQA